MVDRNGSTLAEIDLGLPGHFSGKVRESWILPEGRRVLVTTDRLSAFDRVIGLVEHKGQVLNQLAAWWFDRTSSIVQNHVIEVPDPNVLIARDVTPLPVEVIMRSRLTGSTDTSMLPKYLAGERKLYGYDMPEGLTPHCALPDLMLTPTTKAQDGGHDTPVTVAEVADSGIVAPDVWAEVCKVARSLFEFGIATAEAAGLILADTKYEFGLDASNNLVLIDEVHTADSSRYWLAEGLEDRLAQGQGPENFDKEPLRLALREAGYSGDGQIPTLSEQTWKDVSNRYVFLYEALTGTSFVPGQRPIADRIKKSMAAYTG